MSDDRDYEEQQQERPRPRVVDKRVSSRPAGSSEPAPQSQDGPVAATPGPQAGAPGATAHEPPPVTAEPAAPPAPEPPAGGPQPGQAEGEVWTPQQEAEAQALLEEMARRPTADWVVNSLVTLVNVAAAKLDTHQLAEAQLAIDALAATIDGVGPRLGEVEQPLRQTLAQLQMAYAQALGPTP